MFCGRGAETDGRLTVERGTLCRELIEFVGGRLAVLLRPVLGDVTVGREFSGAVVQDRETVARGAAG